VLLIGCGYGGLTIDSSIRAILQGIQNANNKINEMNQEGVSPVDHVEFVELYEDRCPFKSLYIDFALQGVLAWIISIPLLLAVAHPAPLQLLDYAGVLLWLTGMLFEAGGDYQLARFKADPANKGKVMDSGFWRYTRHPNYFGEFCIWWGFYLIAVAAGGWWTIYAPALMTFLLLRVSGVALLEKDIGKRRPAYRDYIARTNAFFPGLPR
jgi:steroid 5-alpha reductase family enzyme